MTDLKTIFDRAGTGKGKDGFASVYSKVIGPRREEPLNLLEIGIDQGHSHQAWLEWLPNATITGIDTFERFAPEDIEVLKDPRMRHYRRNSTWGPPKDMGKLDFIIDDGCHWHAAQTATFLRYWPLLKKGGSYFIEDVWPFAHMRPEWKKHPFLLGFPGAWSNDLYDLLITTIRVGRVTEWDLRGGENNDNFVLQIDKV
jgi:hypothetical protein